MPWPGSIRIKVSIANVCGSDIHTWQGDNAAGRRNSPFPVIPGHEMMGTIDQLGEGVTTDTNGQPLAVGDRVVYGYTFPCRSCAYCLTGRTHLLHQQGAGPQVQRGHGAALPGRLRAVLLPVPEPLRLQVPGRDRGPDRRDAELRDVAGDLRAGGGPVRPRRHDRGAGRRRARPVRDGRRPRARRRAKIIVIDGVPERLELAESFGAHELIDLRELPEPEQRIKRVWELTGGIGAEIACDFVGFPAVMLEGLQMLGNGGRYLEVGNINTGLTCEFEPNLLVRRHLRIIGMLQYEPRHLKQAVDFVKATQQQVPVPEADGVRVPADGHQPGVQGAGDGEDPARGPAGLVGTVPAD